MVYRTKNTLHRKDRHALWFVRTVIDSFGLEYFSLDSARIDSGEANPIEIFIKFLYCVFFISWHNAENILLFCCYGILSQNRIYQRQIYSSNRISNPRPFQFVHHTLKDSGIWIQHGLTLLKWIHRFWLYQWHHRFYGQNFTKGTGLHTPQCPKLPFPQNLATKLGFTTQWLLRNKR